MLIHRDQQGGVFASGEEPTPAIRFRSREAIGLYWVYRNAKGKDDSREKNQCVRPSEVADHPNARFTGLATNGEMTRIGRGESPERSRLRLKPNGLGIALEVNM